MSSLQLFSLPPTCQTVFSSVMRFCMFWLCMCVAWLQTCSTWLTSGSRSQSAPSVGTTSTPWRPCSRDRAERSKQDHAPLNMWFRKIPTLNNLGSCHQGDWLLIFSAWWSGCVSQSCVWVRRGALTQDQPSREERQTGRENGQGELYFILFSFFLLNHLNVWFELVFKCRSFTCVFLCSGCPPKSRLIKNV